MLKNYKKIFLFICLTVMIILPPAVLAVNPASETLDKISTGEVGPYVASTDNQLLSTIIGTVISVALSLIGTIFLVLMLYAGYNWMVARGDEEKVTQAKDTITRAIIGMIIVIGAYAIWAFIFKQLF
jgi:hypothetical protein